MVNTRVLEVVPPAMSVVTVAVGRQVSINLTQPDIHIYEKIQILDRV